LWTISRVRSADRRGSQSFASMMSNDRLTVMGAGLDACGNFAKRPTDGVCLQYRLTLTSVVIATPRSTQPD
jgi:hypothetical protein